MAEYDDNQQLFDKAVMFIAKQMFDDKDRPSNSEGNGFYDWFHRQFKTLVLDIERWSSFHDDDLACDEYGDCWYEGNLDRRGEYVGYRLKNPTKWSEDLLVYCNVCFDYASELPPTVKLENAIFSTLLNMIEGDEKEESPDN